MNYQKILDNIHKEIKPLIGTGKVTNSIPKLAKISPQKFGMTVLTNTGKQYNIGDTEENFSIQSISKVFLLTMAMQKHKEETIWKRVGLEPSGNPFNSLVQLEYEKGKPRNPFINSGAIVITDMVMNKINKPEKEIRDFVRKISKDKTIEYDNEIAESEKSSEHRNAALTHLLKSYENIENDVNKVLNCYIKHCSLSMNCTQLATAFQYLANSGILPWANEAILTPRQTKRINTLLLTCGTYDAVGDFAYHVGIPAKSGVGGGIAAIIPGLLSVVVWSPPLNENGNSLIGTKALELFTTKTGVSIF